MGNSGRDESFVVGHRSRPACVHETAKPSTLAQTGRSGSRLRVDQPYTSIRWKQLELNAAQIRAFDFFVCAQRARAIVQNDSAGLEDVAVMRNFQGEIGVLFDQ